MRSSRLRNRLIVIAAALAAVYFITGKLGLALAAVVQERRRALETLEKRAADLARSNAKLEQFAHMAAHDLQEPLRMVASYVELLARRYRGRLDVDADEFIAQSIDGAVRMKELVDGLGDPRFSSRCPLRSPGGTAGWLERFAWPGPAPDLRRRI